MDPANPLDPIASEPSAKTDDTIAQRRRSGPLGADEAPDSASIVIRAEVARCITFATHQCDVPVIADLVIENPREEILEGLTLRLSTDPKMIGDRQWTIDRIGARSEFRLSDRRVSIEGGLLDSLTERMRGTMRVELRRGESLLAESQHEITALARNEWGGARHMPELLAAFVMPNDPAVQRLLKSASGLLKSGGKVSSLEGYQARSRKRSWEIVSGIWAAVSQRAITYAEPPASFGRDGQKIRTPSMIEEQGLATCLDTALLFAAAIEQAGLYPVVVFTEGHALAGAWLQRQTLPSLTVEDPMEIRKAIAQDELILFETTMATGGHAMPLTRAIAEGRRQVSEAREGAFIYAIDIRQARGRDIQPLSGIAKPTAAGGPGQPADLSRTAPPLDEAPDLPPFDGDQEVQRVEPTPAERLERWKRSLLDLSKRNRLLNLRLSATAIPIFCPNAALLEDKIAAGGRIRMITPPDRHTAEGEPDGGLYHLRTGEDFSERFAAEALDRNEIVVQTDAKALEKGIIELYRKAKADFEEGGSNTLFLALGMLRWSPDGDKARSYRAPVLMLPVRLERSSARSKPSLVAHDDDPVINLTLLQMLRQDFQLVIPELEGELPRDDNGIDVSRVWTIVKTRVRDVPGFELVQEVVLSTFSFAKYLMWKDLADRTETLKGSPFVRHIIDTPRAPYEGGASFLDPREIDRRIHPAELIAPLNADSSQTVAIHASGGDGDFVLEGPPGTGKSETIGNVIAHNLGLGRTVLFVSEKMAALDVVYRRLRACGLGDFCLELHSAKANKRAVIDQLGSAWEKRHAQPAQEWQKRADQLAAVRERLNGVVEALHKPGPGGISPRDAVGRSLRFGDVHRLRLDWAGDPEGRGKAPTPKDLDVLKELAKRVGQEFGRLQSEDLRGFQGIAHTDWSYAWVGDMVEAARCLGSAIEELIRRRSDFAKRLALDDAGGNPDESSAIADIAAMVPDCAALDLRFSLEDEGRAAMDLLETLCDRLDAYRTTRNSLATAVADNRIASASIADWTNKRARAKAMIWPFRIIARNRLRTVIRTALGVDKAAAPAPDADIETLEALQRLQSEIHGLSQRLPVGTPWRSLESDSTQLRLTIRAGRRLREAVLRLAGFGRDIAEIRTVLARSLCDDREMLEPGRPIASAARELAVAHTSFATSLARFRALSGLDGIGEGADANLEVLARKSAAIVDREKRLNIWCSWVAVCREARSAGLGVLIPALETGSVEHSQCVEAFLTAYACWLAPILIDARPPLNRFSSVSHEDLIQSFRKLDRELAELTSSYIRAKLSAGVPSKDSRHSDPGYGVLARELQKRMKHKPVRQLVSEMGTALSTLTPCLMMSPLSVAQFLPAEVQAFDLVVFDEASQITVPDGIGAIARGRRCIVVGDPQQLPPTRFFERGADDEENDDAQDLESILEEAIAARVPHHRLTGHYRSRHESLICFSNHAYYGGSLVTFPSADTRETAVTFRRVEGVYAKGKARRNEIEAKAVVAETMRRLLDPNLNQLSIGIVTLNSEQQRLVEDLLDLERRGNPDIERFFMASDSTKSIGADTEANREPVFVKNIETVQGDQRDVILLSIGYGPNEPGARTMSMNFGPLNRSGGERRLNVAITRATTEVVVFASFDSGMIDLTRTSSRAIRDLKHYIDFAARGPVALGDAIRSVGAANHFDSDFEMAIAERLRQLGWTVHAQIGVSKFRIDLGVVHPDEPGRFLAGIECDGATYHSSPTARDRDRVRQIILETLGWRLFRVWSTDFFLDADDSITALDSKLKALVDADRAAAAARAADARPDAATPSAETPTHAGRDDDDEGVIGEADHEPVANTYEEEGDMTLPAPSTAQVQPSEPEVAKRHGHGSHLPNDALHTPDPARFHELDYAPRIRAMAASMIDAEGPITFKQVSDRIARAHGFQRTGKQISSTVWRACARVRAMTRTPDQHSVFWPKDVEPQAVSPFRGLAIRGEPRAWREVPYPEKIALVRTVLAQGTDDVARSVADVIGFGRVTSQFRTEIAELMRASGHA